MAQALLGKQYSIVIVSYCMINIICVIYSAQYRIEISMHKNLKANIIQRSICPTIRHIWWHICDLYYIAFIAILYNFIKESKNFVLWWVNDSIITVKHFDSSKRKKGSNCNGHGMSAKKWDKIDLGLFLYI